MGHFCLGRGLAVSRWVREIGGGMNLRRPKFTVVVDDVADDRVPALAVADKDRLARFGFGCLEHIAARAGGEILVANQQLLSAERELTWICWRSCASLRAAGTGCGSTAELCSRGCPRTCRGELCDQGRLL
jgi:predicted site-specific integrase-resolvase